MGTSRMRSKSRRTTKKAGKAKHSTYDVWASVSTKSSHSEEWRQPRDVHVLVSATGHGWIVRK